MENSNKICRFCLFGEKNISDKFVNICSLDYFGEKLSNCLGINVSPEDSIPPLICENCFNFTHKIHNFLMTVERSEIVLKELFAAESRKPLDKKGDNINNSNEKRLINCHSTPQIIDEIHSSNEFISCDSDSSDDNIIKSENQVVDSFSSPDLQKKKSITFPPQQNKVDIFGTDEMKKKLYEYIYTCSICSRSFHTFFEYQDHQHLHNGQLAFHCSNVMRFFRIEMSWWSTRRIIKCLVKNVM
ncbi:hypothetical protein JTB14_001946 [Gonioctena quinquepunctata]|nr:hypothetical protein JTB14_001946 [Gonioctena quinquepunctata]